MNFLSNIPDIYKGAIFTFVILVIIEFIKNKINRNEHKKSFIIFVKLELSAIIKNLDKIKLKVTEQGFFDFNSILEIEKNLSELEGARPSAIYVADKNQKEYFDILVEIRSLVNECRFIQKTYYDHLDLFEGRKDIRDLNQIFKTPQDNQHFFDQKKIEKIISITDIKTKTDNFVKELETDSKS